MAAKRINKELMDWMKVIPTNLCGGPKGDDLYHWEAVLIPPRESPYYVESGTDSFVLVMDVRCAK